MTVYTCSPDLASILTCIYEAWNSRLGYRNVRLMTEPVGNLELFCDYCHVEPDTEKAASVTRSIQKKIGAAAWRLVYLCAMSERSDRSRHHLSFSALRLFLWKGYPTYAAGTDGIPRF